MQDLLKVSKTVAKDTQTQPRIQNTQKREYQPLIILPPLIHNKKLVKQQGEKKRKYKAFRQSMDKPLILDQINSFDIQMNRYANRQTSKVYNQSFGNIQYRQLSILQYLTPHQKDLNFQEINLNYIKFHELLSRLKTN